MAGIKINKKDLVSIIQRTEPYSNPNVDLEQYCIDAGSAADIVFFAGFEFNDIENRIIFDLGTGTGRLSIASAFLKAFYVMSVDIDLNALRVLRKNILSLDLDNIIFPLCADIRDFEISKVLLPPNVKITTIMNPPFGVQKRAADRIFLEKAFCFSDVVYSIHITGEKVKKFISDFVSKYVNWRIDNILPINLILERTFQFHTQKTKMIDVNLYRFVKK